MRSAWCSIPWAPNPWPRGSPQAIEPRIAASDSSDPGDLIVRGDLPFAEAKQRVIDAFEARYLRQLFDRCEGNVSAVARAAEVDRKHLRTLLRKHGILPG